MRSPLEGAAATVGAQSFALRQSRALAVTWSTRRSFLRCFEGEQQCGDELTAVCWLHRGWQQAVVRSLAAWKRSARRRRVS